MGSSRSSVLSGAGKRADRLGSETPRIFTPPLRKLTPETSAGFECIEFAEQVLGILLFPWQRWLLIHALELRPDGTYRFRTIVLLVARQNGKSTLLAVLSLWRMYVDGAPLVIGTAQNLDVAEELWEFALGLAESVPELAAELDTPIRTNGKKTMRLLSGERYKVAAASRRGGRGLSGDLVLLDELREHQKWDAWAAVTKTTMARVRAQVWAASNAGDRESIVLGFLRLSAHAALGNPDGLDIDLPPMPDGMEGEDEDSLGLFEWSAPPDCEVWDRDAWPQANPSLGYGITERAIAGSVRTDPEPVVRTEVLCQWVDVLFPSVIAKAVWDRCHDHRTGPVGQVAFSLDVSPARDTLAFAVAAESARGGVHVEVVSHGQHPGNEWITREAKRLQDDHGGTLALVAGSPASSLQEDLEAAGVKILLIPAAEYVQSCGDFYDAVTQSDVLHLDQAELNAAVAGADRRWSGDAWYWARRTSVEDITPLVAVTTARWAHLHAPVKPALSVW